MKNTSPMTSSKRRRARAALFVASLFGASLLLAGCAEKKPDAPLTDTEKAGFKERNARH